MTILVLNSKIRELELKLADSRRGNSLEGSDGIQADQDSSSPDNGGKLRQIHLLFVNVPCSLNKK